ncbi:LysR family transcriptional regulator [Sphingomonas sp.]|uniref:LysR family transcriptional regulator n=1 Tax=Sphingomonas sp. TaxID=28214 RepID=UPI0035BBFAE1
MTDSPAIAAPPAPVQPRAHWTPARQRIFLHCLVETGSVARAARAAGMSRSSAHRLRVRLAGTPFDRTWDHALTVHAERLADPFAADAAGGAPTQPAGGVPVAEVARL